jgi:predicted DNA-binding transcriptional regulator AlpA
MAAKVHSPTPSAAADVALLDIRDVCAAYRASKSWVYAEIAAGRLPAPAVSSPRFSRWRVADIRADLTRRAGAAPSAPPPVPAAPRVPAPAARKAPLPLRTSRRAAPGANT